MNRGKLALGAFIIFGNAFWLIAPDAPLLMRFVGAFFMLWGGLTIRRGLKPRGVGNPTPPPPITAADLREARRARRAAEHSAWEAQARNATPTYRKDTP